MPNYCVNKNTHEVHDLTPNECPTLPDNENRVSLGWHATCKGAVQEAKSKNYTDADGCKNCCEDCHTK